MKTHQPTALLIFSLLLGSLPAQTVRSYDVGTVLAPMPRQFPMDELGAGLFLPTVPVLVEAMREEWPSKNTTYGFPGAGLSRDRLVSLVSDFGGVESDDVTLWRERLTFRGSAAKHDRLRDLLMMIEESSHPPMRLEVWFLEGELVPERANLDAEEFQALLADSKKRVVHRSAIRSDVAEDIRSGTQQSFIYDWYAQVAQGATAYDPRMTRVQLGLCMGLVASVLADGRIELVVGLQEADSRGKVKGRELLGELQGAIHHPMIDSRLIVSRGVITDGGALVLGGVSEKHGLCVIRCQLEPRQPSGRTGLFQAISLGDILHPMPRLRGVRPPLRLGEEEIESSEDRDNSSFQETLRAAVGAERPSDLEWLVLGNRLVVVGDDDELMRTVSKRIEGLVRKRAATRQTLSLAIRTGGIDDELAASFLDGKTSVDALAEKVPQVGVLATLPGHSFQHIEGLETTYIRDQEVRLAQKATGSNPYVQTAFSGFSLIGALRKGVNGTLSLDGTFYHARVDIERIDTIGKPARDLDLVARRFVQQEIRSVPIRRGHWQVLSLRKNPGGNGYLVLMTRVAL